MRKIRVPIDIKIKLYNDMAQMSVSNSIWNTLGSIDIEIYYLGWGVGGCDWIELGLVGLTPFSLSSGWTKFNWIRLNWIDLDWGSIRFILVGSIDKRAEDMWVKYMCILLKQRKKISSANNETRIASTNLVIISMALLKYKRYLCVVSFWGEKAIG